MAQFYAACRQNGALLVKHIQLTLPLQFQLDGVFQRQEVDFMRGINTEITFTGDWKPDDDELLVAHALPEAQILVDAANQNAVALPVLDVNHFDTEGIKAVFTVFEVNQNKRLLLQNFSNAQILSSTLAFLFDGNVFRRLTEPTFSLGTQLSAIIDANANVRFKSFNMVRRIFDMAQFYRQATDAEVDTFCRHQSLVATDIQAFIDNADEGIRKFIHAMNKSDVLNTHTVTDIGTQANAIQFPITITNGKIEIPATRKSAKALFSFLLNRVYRGPLDQQLLITNSNRPLA